MGVRQLARDARISASYVTLIEQGAKGNVSHDVLVRLARALGVTPTVLSGEQSDDGRPGWREYVLTDPGLDSDDRRRVLDFVERLRGTLDDG